MEAFGWIVLFLSASFVLSFKRASLSVWAISYFVLLLLVSFFSHVSTAWMLILWVLAALLFVPILILPFRRQFITRHILAIYRKVMPSMSSTEKEALSAGGVGWERELFTGMPDWQALQKMPKVELSAEEQAFLDGPVEELCSMISNWEINHKLHKIPDEIWQFLKSRGFFSLIIPKAYGGKEFSALAHSQIIVKVASISVAVGTVVSVPNSLGPAELLLEYGTEAQKDYYLPRLAKGEEFPCFALTSPVAGSDAGAIDDYGVVCKRVIDGKERLGILLNWDKRYITLAPVATLLGLAFKLYDPDHLIGDKESVGITCALIPVDTPGVTIGRRHFPICSHFPNGPTQGKDVFIPMNWVIGGQEMVGSGWRMLMECLAAGRSISLPSMVTGGAKKAVYTTGAYARIRRQFNTHIGAFGGIKEALARIGGYTYIIEALRLFGVSSIDLGVKSAVGSAICKCHTTNYARHVVNDAMDIHGGKGIMMGPNNYMTQSYIEGPISITVEGANILTRSMIIFGQGAIRAHPYVLREMSAAQDKNETRSLRDFDDALFRHMGMIGSNKVRSYLLALSSSWLAAAPAGDLKRYYQHFSRFSSAFSFVADMAMITIGGKLKRKERLSARLGDMLSMLYIGSSVMKYYEQQDIKEALPMARWACDHLLYELQNSFHEFFQNMPNRWMARMLRGIVFPLGRRFSPPDDRLSKKVAELLLEPTRVRGSLSKGMYRNEGKHHNPLSYIEEAFVHAIEVEPLLKRLRQAEKSKKVQGMVFADRVASAMRASCLTDSEGERLMHAHKLRMRIVNVDDFSAEDFFKTD